MALITKIIAWVGANGATVLGGIQVILKAIKEILTGVVNILSLFMTHDAAEKVVKAVRGAVNFVDGIVEKIKGYLV